MSASLRQGGIPEAEMNVHDWSTCAIALGIRSFERRPIPRTKSIEVDVHSTASGLEAIENCFTLSRRIKAAKGKNPTSVVESEGSPGPVNGGDRINQTDSP